MISMFINIKYNAKALMQFDLSILTLKVKLRISNTVMAKRLLPVMIQMSLPRNKKVNNPTSESIKVIAGQPLG